MNQRNDTTAMILRELQTETGIVQVAQRPADGYIHLNPLAKASGREVYTWTRSQDTQEYLAVLSSVPQNCGTELLQQIQGGTPRLQGTWAHPLVALKFAAWCDKHFEVQVYKWIDLLRTAGVVDIRPEPANPIQHALTAIAEAVHALDTRKADVIQLYDVERQLVLRIDKVQEQSQQSDARLRDELQHGFGKIEQRLELNRQAALTRARRTAPKGHELWWWRISGGQCINPQCRTALDELSPVHAYNHPVYDEIIPVKDGGQRCIANLQLICWGCNSKKSAQWTDYRPRKVIADAYQADIEGAQYHKILREQLSQQPGLFDIKDDKQDFRAS